MEYPRQIVLQNPKLKKLLEEKAEFITLGREKSAEIDELDIQMEAIDKDIQAIEKSVDLTDLKAEAEEINKEMEAAMAKADALNKKTFERMKEKTVEKVKEYEELKKKKEKVETERNKFALKANQKTDKIIPLGQKLMKEHIEDEFEDYDTIRLENGEIVCTLFSHLADFQRMYRAKKSWFDTLDVWRFVIPKKLRGK